MPFLTAGSAIYVYALGQILHVMGLFLMCLDKLPLESLYWSWNVVKSIVTSSVFNIVVDFWHHRWKLWFKRSKIFGKWTLSYTWKLMVLMANNFCCCGICAVYKSHIDTDSTWGQFLSPCQISKLSTNDFRKHWWAISNGISLLIIFSSFRLIYMLHSQSNVQIKQIKSLVLLISPVIVPAFFFSRLLRSWLNLQVSAFLKHSVFKTYCWTWEGMMFCECEMEWS